MLDVETLTQTVARSAVPVVLLFGNAGCKRCPPVKEAAEELRKSHFLILMHATPSEAPELVEHFGVHSLPALVFLPEGSDVAAATALQPVAAAHLEARVRATCAPRAVYPPQFSLDEDF